MDNTKKAFGIRTLGRTGLKVGPIGLGAAYGAEAKAYELAFEHGLNYFYWGSFRKNGMRDAIRTLAPNNREKMVITIQTYTRWKWYVPFTVTRALKQLKIDYADVLLLGWYDKPPKQKLLDAVFALKEKGLIKKIAISCHHRPQFETYIKDKNYDIIMTRYNAAHRGSEKEVFPFLDSDHSKRPGVISYTTTRWSDLLNPKFTPKGMKTPLASDCYRFALTNPNVDMALCGPKNLNEMTENLKALELGPMSNDEMEWMKAVGNNVRANTGFKPFPDK